MSKQDEGHRLTDAQLTALEKRIARVYGQAAKEVQAEVNAYFKAFARRDAEQRQRLDAGEITEQQYKQWRLAQMGRGKRFTALRDKLAERMTRANEVAAAYVNDATPGIYSLNRNYAAYTIEQVAGDVGFTLWDEQTAKRLLTEQPDLMPYYPPARAIKRGIDLAYGKKQISAQMTSGILMGESIGKLADRLQRHIPEMSRTSAIRAARTAMTGAECAGRQDTYLAAEKMGLKLKKRWLATLDGRTRHAHALLDGQTAAPGKPFMVDGYKLMFPGDKSAPAYLVYNCRCTVVADLDGVDTSDARRWARDPETGEKETVTGMTYQEWIAAKRKEYGGQEVDTAKRWTSAEERDKIEKRKQIGSGEKYVYHKGNQANQSVEGLVRRPKVDFTPATTTDEADAYLKKLGVVGEYTKGRINIDVANAVNKTVTEYKNVFGDSLKLRGIKKWPKRDAEFVAAYSPVFGDVFLYKVQAKDTMERMLRDAIDEYGHGAWSTNKAEHFIRHELGHALHSGVGKKTQQDALQKLYDDALSSLEWGKHGFTVDEYKKAGLTGKKYLEDLKQAGSILSGYGFTSVDEMVAESVAEYMAGNPRSFALKVVNTLMGW